MNDPRIERLRDGATVLEVAPDAGGVITRYGTETDGGPVDYLRPATAGAVQSRTPTEAACFPLVPFSNRIRDGRFTFRGRAIELPPNFPPEPHAIHGHGWRARWEVVERSNRTLELEYTHDADAWPFPYRARQRFALDRGALRVEISVRNEGEEPMPVGFGLHPYFVRTPETTVQAEVERVWIPDETAMPERLLEPPPDWDLEGGLRPDDVALDNNFTGWSGRAVVTWPERETRMVLEAEGPFGVLIVYSPPGEPYVCVEPATNVIDAFNLEASGRTDTGTIVLEPADGVEGAVRFVPTDPTHVPTGA